MSEYILSYGSLIGRGPTRKDMIINKKLKFDSIEKCKDWVQKNFEPNSVWWVYYTIAKEKEIMISCENKNLKLVNGNYLENRQ